MARFIGTTTDDRVTGTDSADRIETGGGNDWVHAGAGADWILAHRGDDVLNGGAGDDTIVGGYGRDILTGGSGADEFNFQLFDTGHCDRADIITDFSRDEGDRIRFNYTGLEFSDIGYSHEDGNTVITFQAGPGYQNQILLEDVVLAMTEGDFLFYDSVLV